jgi:putative ABC transport system permease protein
MSRFVVDARDAWRGVLHQRAFSAAAVITLSIGIAATTTIFAVIRAVVLELPFDQPDRIVTIIARGGPGGSYRISREQFESWRQASDVFETAAAYTLVSPVMTGGDAALRLQAEAMTAGMFAVLGVQPRIGRAFRDDERDVVLVSDPFWRARLDADWDVLGRQIVLDGIPTTIIGVMPPGFDGPRSRPGDVWLPFSAARPVPAGRPLSVSVVARLAPGATPAAVRTRLESMPFDAASHGQWTPSVETARENFLYQDALSSINMLIVGVALVLLMACVNVASLLLGRNISRRRELGLRLAVGATRWNIVRQVTIESLILSGGGALLGLLIAWWAVTAMVPLIPRWFPRIAQIDVDLGVAAFAAIAAAATGIVVSAWPAWSASRQDFGALMKSGERGNRGGMRGLRTALVVVEATLGMIVLTVAALLVGSFNRLNPTDPGFAFADRTKFSLRFAGPRYQADGARVAAVQDLTAGLRRIPGVLDASSATHLPLAGTSATFSVRLDHAEAGSPQRTVHYRAVLPNYFSLMAMPILKGRGLTATDTARSQPVVVVNDTLAAQLLPGREPLGAELVVQESEGSVVRRIVGVVRDVRASGGNLRSWPEMFVPYAQLPPSLATFVVRTAPGAPHVEADMRRTVLSFDPSLPVDRLEPLTAVVARSVAEQRLFAVLMGAFAIVSCALAFAGLYAVATWSVTQRTREIGVRVALGATSRDVHWMVLRHGAAVGLAGAATGALAAMASSRWIESYLYGFPAQQPALVTGLGLAFALTVMAAAYVPARRATRVDPMVVLRTE